MSISDWSSDVCSSDLKDLVICLFSGGASALIADCPEGITLKELQETSGLLLRSGADIAEINTVRKHLSTLKGGQLARRAEPARVMALLISDVVGDDPGTIASGPRSEEHTSELQSLMRISYAVFCLKKKKHIQQPHQ